MVSNNMGRTELLVMVVAMATLPLVISQKTEYFMDNRDDCGKIGAYTISDTQKVTLHAKTEGGSGQVGCSLNFMAAQTDSKLSVEFSSIVISDCSVSLQISGGASLKSYTCGAGYPSTYYTLGRTLGITLYVPSPDKQNFDFTLLVVPIPKDRYPAPSDSNPAAVGLVIGIVGGVFGLIFIVSCVGICCFRKYRARGSARSPFNHDKPRIDENNSVSVGYTNESMNGSPYAKKKLLSQSDSSGDDKLDLQRPRTLNLRGNNNKSRGDNFDNRTKGDNNRNGLGRTTYVPPPAPPPPPPNYSGGSSDDNSQDVFGSQERGIDVVTRPKNDMLGALKNNPKFRNSFKSNEKDANERAQRISSSSSLERFGPAPSPPGDGSNRPSLPPVPKSPKGKKSKHAGINRAPRPTSLSENEVKKLEKGFPRDGQDPDIRVLRDDHSTSSSSEVVAINVKADQKRKADTVHALKPDRGNRGKKKQTKSVSSALDPEPKPSPRMPRDRVQSTDDELGRPRGQVERLMAQERDLGLPFEKMGSGRYSKGKGRKSPRPGKGSGRGFSHRRGRSADRLDSRPTTPTSAFGSMEDLDSIPRLQRYGSKNSLYSSRSSLYDRRRQRKNSTGSYVSYRDDISVGRYSDSDEDFDGYEKPLSRKDRERLYRSENDLGRRPKEAGTQTLRETATQTGEGVAVVVQNKMLVKKKKPSKSVSSSGTQTVKKSKSKSIDNLAEEKGYHSDKEKKRKNKRSKSMNSLENAVDETDSSEKKEKPKVRPKPRPRKSTSADTMLEEKKIASQENLAADPNANPYYPGSEGFVPQQPYYPSQGYQGMPPPAGYPGQAGNFPGQAGNYPIQPGNFPGQQGVPMQGQYPQYPGQANSGYPNFQPNQPQQQAHNGLLSNVPAAQVPKQRNKSNWEMLCEITDSHRERDDITETGSVASSVFTNNPASLPNYGNPPTYQQFHNYPPPPKHMLHSNSVPDYENAAYRALNYENADVRAQNGIIHTSSSWDALKAATNPKAGKLDGKQQSSESEV
ncbi:nucleolar protein dao-5-like [Mya arenaria]|uniref:nucleolar protein dao-5-like n=1 Tax=Mya arenaria TaxID=6604 RepID=UPI0022E8A87A|nr:nucleolar protein dao-5-like [Mya arenaria]XP_052780294.1 nucleolar protein dao-5-like [Mya arenaria]